MHGAAGIVSDEISGKVDELKKGVVKMVIAVSVS
jgi:hypothetical protein